MDLWQEIPKPSSRLSKPNLVLPLGDSKVEVDTREGDIKSREEKPKYHGELLLKELMIRNRIAHSSTYIPEYILLGRVLIYFVIQGINYHKFEKYTISDGMIFLSLLMITASIHHVNLEFIIFGVIDFRRKLFFQKTMSALIDAERRIDSTSLINSLPHLNLLDSDNLRNWMDLRRSSLDLGQKFTLRVFLYSSIFVILYGSMALFLTLTFFNLLDYDIPLSVSLLGFYDVFCIVGVLIYMIRIGAEVNQYFFIHRQKLLNIKTSFLRVKHNYNKLSSRRKYICDWIKIIMVKIKELNLDDAQRGETIDDCIGKFLKINFLFIFQVTLLFFNRSDWP